ncbi:Uncharacterised protein [Streptococcus pneumoniae]|nr:Uncharacterised protein [Streptococcus pneumoniae]
MSICSSFVPTNGPSASPVERSVPIQTRMSGILVLIGIWVSKKLLIISEASRSWCITF